ncbi:MAG: transcriptional regulator [Burkholderiaceae bacterium]|jgi:nitrogen regulatory protein P-II 2|nr:transcriptional regulator [Burkholderiaceae bacterium]
MSDEQRAVSVAGDALPTFEKTLLVVLCEALLEKPLLSLAKRMGALGYTVHDVRGGGSWGTRDAMWEADRSIEVKFICASAVAKTIANAIVANYGEDYALSLYLSPVEVLRGHKY